MNQAFYYKKQGLKSKKLLKRQKSNANLCQKEIDSLRQLAESRREAKAEIQSKYRALQNRHVEVKRQLLAAKAKLCKTKQKDPLPQPDEESEEPETFRLKDERGYFKKEVIITVMALVGECELPPSRCGKVIQTIMQQLANISIPDEDLPPSRSALRFADRGHVIAKMHVADALKDCDSWDLHTDGTSRSGKKYVGQQLNVDGQLLSTGFTPVATEDSTILVDITFNLLQELCEISEDTDAHQRFFEILQSMSGGMNDRAEVMKCFMKKMDKERKEMLENADTLEFLNCNAHFLLGLSSESEKALLRAEKENGEKLGRDKLPQVRSFQSSTEGAAARYIRLACDCLGPRGDDKSGCRDMWETYCMMMGQPSTITSYRSNRFNNLFEAAASLHFHRQDIKDCLGTYLAKRNRKIESVFADNACQEIDCSIVALGILFYRLTGPYWQLLSKEVHNLDLYKYIAMLHRLIRQWAQNADDAFSSEFEPLFGDKFMPKPHIFSSLVDIDSASQDAVKKILQQICQGMVEVTERQLKDFLPGGRYFAVESQALREKMKNSKLTNLIGEQ